MKIIPKLDAGPYMLQEKINIESEDNYQTLSLKLSAASFQTNIEIVRNDKKK